MPSDAFRGAGETRQGATREAHGDLFQAWAAARAKVGASNSLTPAVMVGPRRPHLMHSQWAEAWASMVTTAFGQPPQMAQRAIFSPPTFTAQPRRTSMSGK
jgi:hypothetical protein